MVSPVRGLSCLPCQNAGDFTSDFSKALSPGMAQRKFQEGDLPPAVPEDRFFHLAATTVSLRSASPWLIGARLVDFFCSEGAIVEKTNPRKFSVKASYFVEGVVCNVKVRVYSLCVDFAVEFQRLGGDVVAFSHMYTKALDYLMEVFGGSGTASSAFFVPFSAPPQSLLLSRACCGAEVRSEALSRLRLWSMACDEGRVESLCEPCVLETLTKFLGGGDAGLKFSAASALLAMATSARGCAFLKESTFSERLETLETLETLHEDSLVANKLKDVLQALKR